MAYVRQGHASTNISATNFAPAGFLPGLRANLGWGWPLIVGLAATGWVLALARGDRMLRMLGAVGVVSFLGYLVTPQSAGGPDGRPVLFESDVRFAFPALVLGLVLLPMVVSPSSHRARVWLSSLVAIALLNDALYATGAGASLLALATRARSRVFISALPAIPITENRWKCSDSKP